MTRGFRHISDAVGRHRGPDGGPKNQIAGQGLGRNASGSGARVAESLSPTPRNVWFFKFVFKMRATGFGVGACW